jgi:hypothetical protein
MPEESHYIERETKEGGGRGTPDTRRETKEERQVEVEVEVEEEGMRDRAHDESRASKGKGI